MLKMNIDNEDHLIIKHGNSGTSVEIQTHEDRSLVSVKTIAGFVDIQILSDGRHIVHESETGGMILEQRIDSVLKSLSAEITNALLRVREMVNSGELLHLDETGTNEEGWLYIDDAARAIEAVMKKYGVRLES